MKGETAGGDGRKRDGPVCGGMKERVMCEESRPIFRLPSRSTIRSDLQLKLEKCWRPAGSSWFQLVPAAPSKLSDGQLHPHLPLPPPGLPRSRSFSGMSFRPLMNSTQHCLKSVKGRRGARRSRLCWGSAGLPVLSSVRMKERVPPAEVRTDPSELLWTPGSADCAARQLEMKI